MTRHVYSGRQGQRSRVARGQPEMIAFCAANGLDSHVVASLVVDDEARTIEAVIYHVDPAVHEGRRHLRRTCTLTRELHDDPDANEPCTRPVTVPLVEDLPPELALLADASPGGVVGDGPVGGVPVEAGEHVVTGDTARETTENT